MSGAAARVALLLVVGLVDVQGARAEVLLMASEAAKLRCYDVPLDLPAPSSPSSFQPDCTRRVFTVHMPDTLSNVKVNIALRMSVRSLFPGPGVPMAVKVNGVHKNVFQVLWPTSSFEDAQGVIIISSLRRGANIIDIAAPHDAIDAILVPEARALPPRGAGFDYVELEAENAKFNGTLIGPDFRFTYLPSEASMRKAVQLAMPGHSVEFLLTAPANALALRFSLPDSSDGRGIDTPVLVFVNETLLGHVILTSRYAWYYGSYPFTKRPSDGKPHHFYDTVYFWLPKLSAPGTRVKFQSPTSQTEIGVELPRAMQSVLDTKRILGKRGLHHHWENLEGLRGQGLGRSTSTHKTDRMSDTYNQQLEGSNNNNNNNNKHQASRHVDPAVLMALRAKYSQHHRFFARGGRVQDQCTLADPDKHDCGFSGINETQCLNRSCCWQPNQPPNPGHIPDCFFPAPPSPPPPPPGPPPPPPPPPTPECTVDDPDKHDCGFYGINETQCLNRSCCWFPNPPPNPGHIPDCYHKAGPLPPPPPPPGPPGPSPPPPPPPPPPGTVVITIDLIDLFNVDPPAAQPPNSYSIVTDGGADPTGAQDATQAIANSIRQAQEAGKVVWVPRGNFTVTQHIMVNNVTIVGAGPWYSLLHGNRVGIFGNSAPQASKNVQVHGISVVGEVKIRDDGDPVNGFGGALTDTVIGNVYISHTKVGMWLDGPFDNFIASGCMIHDTTADGINFHMGVTNSIVEHTVLRNLGDDGLAMWSDQHPDVNNTFRFNTVQIPVLANNLAIYGGTSNSMHSNLVFDTITQGGGLHVGNRFNSVPLDGDTVIFNNAAHRCGCLDPNWNFGVGAMWFYALDHAMTGHINVTDNFLIDSPYEAIHFIGNSVDDVDFLRVNITNAGTFAFQFQCGGSATVTDVVAAGIGFFGQYNCGVPIKLTYGPGNSGWNTTHCGWPSLF